MAAGLLLDAGVPMAVALAGLILAGYVLCGGIYLILCALHPGGALTMLYCYNNNNNNNNNNNKIIFNNKCPLLQYVP